MMKKLKIDDVVDAFPVHGACGIWGVVALGLFGNPDEEMGGNGLFYGGDQLRVQVMACIVIMAWTSVLRHRSDHRASPAREKIVGKRPTISGSLRSPSTRLREEAIDQRHH